MQTGTKLKPGELPPDHEDFMTWCETHSDRAWGFFLKWLATSPYDFRAPEDSESSYVGRTRAVRKFREWLATQVNRRNDKERQLFDWTLRAVYHVNKSHKYSLRNAYRPAQDDAVVTFRKDFA